MTELSCLRVLIEKETHSIPIAQYMITIAMQRMHMQNALIGDDINEILKLAHEHLSCAIDSRRRLATHFETIYGSEWTEEAQMRKETDAADAEGMQDATESTRGAETQAEANPEAETYWWETFPHTGRIKLSVGELPELLMSSLKPHLDVLYKGFKNGHSRYHYVGTNSRGSSQIQLSMDGKGCRYLGHTGCSTVAAVMVTAALIDRRLGTKLSLRNWIVCMSKGGNDAVCKWLLEVGSAIDTMPVKKSQGGRPSKIAGKH